jgi:hypothetical protein
MLIKKEHIKTIWQTAANAISILTIPAAFAMTPEGYCLAILGIVIQAAKYWKSNNGWVAKPNGK